MPHHTPGPIMCEPITPHYVIENKGYQITEDCPPQCPRRYGVRILWTQEAVRSISFSSTLSQERMKVGGRELCLENSYCNPVMIFLELYW